MTFKDIKNALEDLFDGTPEIWRDLCADDIHFESIHSSHSGNSVKTKDEMYAIHQELGSRGDADVRCLIETDSVISVTHASPRSSDEIYVNVSHIEDGKVKACYYAKTNR